jgi:4-amino-4-deoxy-L-arabinose transferase-like glycosyltransferase
VVSGALDQSRVDSPETEKSVPRRFGLAAWLLVALQTMLMLGATVLYPPFQEPDEVSHIDYVIAHREGEWLDDIGQRHFQSGVLKARSEVPNTAVQAHIGSKPVPARSARESFDALGTAPSKSPFPNQMVQHPPLYYGLAAGFSYLLPNFSHQRFDVQIFWLRLLSVLLLAPVPLLIYGAALRATKSRNIGLVAAVIPLAIPSYLRTGASVTNDSLLTLLTVAMAALLVRIAWGDRTRRTAVLLGLAWGAALLTKGFALALPPAIVLAYLVGAHGTLRNRLRMSWSGMLLSGAIGFAIGGWWWIRNVVLYGTVQPDGFATLSDSVRQLGFGRDHVGGTDLDFFVRFMKLLARRIWGSLGLIDQPSLPALVLFPMTVLLVACIVAGVLAGVPRWRGTLAASGWTVGRAVSLILPALLTLSVMYAGSRSTYLKGHALGGVQARYLVPAVLGIVICAAVGLDRVAGRWRRWLPLAALTASLTFVAASAYVVLDVEMSSGGPDRVRRLKDALHFVANWAPFPTAVTIALLALTIGLAGATCVVFARAAMRDTREPTSARTAAGDPVS